MKDTYTPKQKYLILSASTKNDNAVPQLTSCLHFDAIALQWEGTLYNTLTQLVFCKFS